MSSNEEILYFNGINGATGDYGLKLTMDQFIQLVHGESNKELLSELQFKQQEPFPLRPDLDPGDLSQAGWGIIFTEKADPLIKEALSELIELRRGQAGQYFKIFAGDDGYRQGDSKNDFLSRHGVGPGLVDPENGVPYYLLIVGSPEEIPYDFQYQLDVQFAVGRLYFATPQEYANYARSVVTAESGKVKLPRRVSFFGVANNDDKATQMSGTYLVKPLFEKMEQENQKKKLDWQMDSFIGEQATHGQLQRLLGGEQTPALLFTASHGLEFPFNDHRQIPYQGALLCQDWPGPVEYRGPIKRDWYFAGEDIASDTNLLGMIAFNFACYGGGTPRYNEFSKQKENPEQIAPYAFLNALPMKMLGLSKGGALATVGHVERAWGHSIVWPGVGGSTTSFEITIRQLLKQFPIGYALEAFNLRYAELSTELTMAIDRREKDGFKLAGMWTANNDARNYVVLGDPAVRLPVAENSTTPPERPIIEVKSVGAPKSDAQVVTATAENSTKTVTPSSGESAVAFGFFGDSASDIVSSLQEVSKKIATTLAQAVDDLTSLQVTTYTSNDLDRDANYDAVTGKFSGGAKLRAMTHISLDGDVTSLIPEHKQQVGEFEDRKIEIKIDGQLWSAHKEMVQLAQTHRVEFIKAVAEIASTMLKVIKP